MSDSGFSATQNSKKRYKEIVNPSGFVNTDKITIGELVGKKVILVDFMTYSCINCQRTFPYLNAWYEKYKDQGLEIIGIHTPEFAFEKNKENVENAMKEFGIKNPIVLDNDYSTWSAYDNHYWPRKYLIDINGNIVYDHIGEGNYEETEMKIVELLEERAKKMGELKTGDSTLVSSSIEKVDVLTQSPETYFGFKRNEYLANGLKGRPGIQDFVLPTKYSPNYLYLGGRWNISGEYAESLAGASIVYRYSSKGVYIVAEADGPVYVDIWQDGKRLNSNFGADVDKSGMLKIDGSRLYRIINNSEQKEHILEIRVGDKKVRFYAFTFG